jgi:hypothetical protein
MRTRADFHVNTYHRFAAVSHNVKAVIAQAHAELIFTFSMEASVTFVAGRVFGPLVLFAGVNFRVDFERDHYNPPLLIGNCNARLWH